MKVDKMMLLYVLSLRQYFRKLPFFQTSKHAHFKTTKRVMQVVLFCFLNINSAPRICRAQLFDIRWLRTTNGIRF